MRVDAPTVYLVDDYQSFRQSTVTILEAAELQVSYFQDADLFLSHLSACSVLPSRACAVSDARTSKMSGLKLVEEMKRREHTIPVMFIVEHADVPLAVEAMRRGAVDVIQEPFSAEALLEAVRLAVMASPEPGGARHGDSRHPNNKLATLSRRELQVAELIVAGKLNKTIANVLGISCKTVEMHRANLMGKLGVRTVPDLVKTYLGIPRTPKFLPAGPLAVGPADTREGSHVARPVDSLV